MIITSHKQLVSRGIISGIVCLISSSILESKTTLFIVWLSMTIWTDLFNIFNIFNNKNSTNNKENCNINDKERRPSWKRELKVDTNNVGTFIENVESLTPKKVNTDKYNSDESEINNSDKKKRKRAGKKVRERLARKKLRTLSSNNEKEESNDVDSGYISDSLTTDTINTNNTDIYEVEKYVDDVVNHFLHVDEDVNYTDENYKNENIIENKDDNMNELNDSDELSLENREISYFEEEPDKYEGQEYVFNESPASSQNVEMCDIVDINRMKTPKTSNTYYQFLKDSAKKVGYNYEDNKESGYLTDGDIRFMDEVSDEMINHRDYDFDNRRILDPDGYWEMIFMKKLNNHIDKYGKYLDRKIEFEKNIKVLINDLQELKETTSALRLLGAKLPLVGILRVNVVWMTIMCSEYVRKCRVGVVGGSSYLNKIWCMCNSNIEKMLPLWGEIEDDKSSLY